MTKGRREDKYCLVKSAMGGEKPMEFSPDRTDEEREFLQAVTKYAQAHHLKYVGALDYLKVLKELGYRKGQPPQEG